MTNTTTQSEPTLIAMQCAHIAAIARSEVEAFYGKELKVVFVSGLHGKAYQQRTYVSNKIVDWVPCIKTPIPKTLHCLSIYLHECGHHLRGHVHPTKNWKERKYSRRWYLMRSQQEAEAEEYTRSMIERHGFTVPTSAIVQGDWNINKYKIQAMKLKQRSDAFVQRLRDKGLIPPPISHSFQGACAQEEAK